MAIISHRHRFIFTPPRKVASTSIMFSLAPFCAKGDLVFVSKLLPQSARVNYGAVQGGVRIVADRPHLLPEVIQKRAGRSWNEYLKFTVVRNPWDWFVSLYHWKIVTDWQKPWRHKTVSPGDLLLRARAQSRLRRVLPNFEHSRHRENIEMILKKNWFFKYLSTMPAYYFLDGRPYADYYMRFENLQHDYNEVCRLLQLPAKPLPRVNDESRGNGGDYRDYYTDWSREYIAQRCLRIINAFGYSF